MSKDDRKAQRRAWKERPTRAGIFCVRCSVSDQAWVSTTRDLETRQNGIWFSLKLGSYPNREVQAAWKAHGEGSFRFEPLEEIEQDPALPDALVLDLRLKDRERHWRETLGATRLTG